MDTASPYYAQVRLQELRVLGDEFVGRLRSHLLVSLEEDPQGVENIEQEAGAEELDRIEEVLRRDHGVADVIRARKPTFTKPAPSDLREDLARRAGFVIEALAD